MSQCHLLQYLIDVIALIQIDGQDNALATRIALRLCVRYIDDL